MEGWRGGGVVGRGVRGCKVGKVLILLYYIHCTV